MTDLLPSLRALRDASPRDTAERDTLTRAVDEIDRLRARRSFQEQVAEFHRALDFPVRDTPTVPGGDEVRLRARLIAEEFFEVLATMFQEVDWRAWSRSVRGVVDRARIAVDLPELAHELADLHYVTSGTAVQLGVDEDAVLAEVHRANLSKAGGGKDANGKAMKGAGFVPADVAAVLRAQGWPGEEPR